jgi:hypothetical protein
MIRSWSHVESATAARSYSIPGQDRDLTMALITRSQVIDNPVAEVFAVVVDGGNFAAWNPTTRSSRRLDEGEIGSGSKFEWDLNPKSAFGCSCR